MATTPEDLITWFKHGVEEKATHMIVVCDTFSYEDYPVYVKIDEDPREKARDYNGKNMQKVMEVYNLNQPMDAQISGERVFNY